MTSSFSESFVLKMFSVHHENQITGGFKSYGLKSVFEKLCFRDVRFSVDSRLNRRNKSTFWTSSSRGVDSALVQQKRKNNALCEYPASIWFLLRKTRKTPLRATVSFSIEPGLWWYASLNSLQPPCRLMVFLSFKYRRAPKWSWGDACLGIWRGDEFYCLISCCFSLAKVPQCAKWYWGDKCSGIWRRQQF